MARYPKRGIHGAAVESIGRRIVQGSIPAGTVLELDSFEREFDASRTVIREALRVLAAKGLVDARPKRGTFVLPRQHWNLLDDDLIVWQFEPSAAGGGGLLRDLAEVRSIIEPAAALLAADRRTDEDVDEMRDALERMGSESLGAAEVIAADLAFHRTLLYATRNELLTRLDLIIATGLRVRDEFVHDRSGWAESIPGHERVLDAVAAGDGVAARAAMIALMEQAAKDVEDVEKVDGPPRIDGAGRPKSGTAPGSLGSNEITG